MNYRYHTQLSAPIADVHELTNLLRQMNFKVVSLLDLNWQEMHSAVTEFLLLLDKGVYGVSLVHLDITFNLSMLFRICTCSFEDCDTNYTLIYFYIIMTFKVQCVGLRRNHGQKCNII